MEINEGKVYRHFKGMLVKVICLAKHSETEEILVIYKHLETGEIWARPIDMFTSLVDREKYPDIKQKYRFEEVIND
jgi:hypothetical protein